jgi:UDP-3-O-[3-hydroxymyristoyl] glucosamine N-acyltransferase
MTASQAPITLGELATRVAQVTPCRLVGEPGTPVRSVCHPRSLEGQGCLVPAWDPEVAGELEALAASGQVVAVLAGQACEPSAGLFSGALIAERPRLALGIVLRGFARSWQPELGVDPTAWVDPSARIAASARVGAFAVVGPDSSVGERAVLHAHVSLGAGAVVGDDSVLHPGARVGDRCLLGRRVVLMPNAVVGADGFSFDSAQPGPLDGVDGDVQPWIKIPSIGHVVLEDDVELGAGSCVDRANLGSTRIGRGTKIDNLVQVGHNNDVGEHCLLCGQAGVSGSCRLGDGVVLAGQAGVIEHRKIGRQAVVLAQSAVFRHLPDGAVVFGTPARAREQWFRKQAAAGRVDSLRSRVKELEARLAALEGRGEDVSR